MLRPKSILTKKILKCYLYPQQIVDVASNDENRNKLHVEITFPILFLGQWHHSAVSRAGIVLYAQLHGARYRTIPNPISNINRVESHSLRFNLRALLTHEMNYCS